MENYIMEMAANIKEILLMEILMEKANIPIKIIFGKAIGKMDIQKEKENKLLLRKQLMT